jgi:hypothetical protein
MTKASSSMITARPGDRADEQSGEQGKHERPYSGHPIGASTLNGPSGSGVKYPALSSPGAI